MRRPRLPARVLLVGLLLVVLSAIAPAVSAVWRVESVRVPDYTTPQWEGMVEGMVEEFTTMLPETAPRLVYRRKPERSCDDLPRRVATGTIIVCSTANASFVGWTRMWGDGTGIYRSHIVLNDAAFGTRRYATNTICHELMHAITGIDDNYDRRPATSCVWGDLAKPGRFDVAYAAKVYPTAKPR